MSVVWGLAAACVVMLVAGVVLSNHGSSASFVLIFGGLWCGFMAGLALVGRDK